MPPRTLPGPQYTLPPLPPSTEHPGQTGKDVYKRQVQGCFGFLCEEGAHPVIHHVAKGGLAEALGYIGYDACYRYVDEGYVLHCLGNLVAPDVLDGLGTVLLQYIIGILRHPECSEQDVYKRQPSDSSAPMGSASSSGTEAT